MLTVHRASGCVGWVMLTVLICSWGARAEKTTASDQLAHAETLYGELEYPAALEEALEVTARTDATPDEVRRAHMLAGIVARIMEKDVDARMHFLRVLEQNPYERLPAGQPPKIVTFYDLIQKEVQRDILERKKAKFAALEKERSKDKARALDAERAELEREKARLAAEKAKLARQRQRAADRSRRERAAEVDRRLADKPKSDGKIVLDDGGVYDTNPQPEEPAAKGISVSLLGWGAVGIGAVGAVLGAAGVGFGVYAFTTNLPELGASFLVAGLTAAGVGVAVMALGGVAIVFFE